MQAVILVGQIYLDVEKNVYITVIKRTGDAVQYAGPGFRGNKDAEVFLELFPPVDPADVSEEELHELMRLCPEGTVPKIGCLGNVDFTTDEDEELAGLIIDSVLVSRDDGQVIQVS